LFLFPIANQNEIISFTFFIHKKLNPVFSENENKHGTICCVEHQVRTSQLLTNHRLKLPSIASTNEQSQKNVFNQNQQNSTKLAQGGDQNSKIDHSHYRLILKLGNEMQINHHS
jgi:hypothetical protein